MAYTQSDLDALQRSIARGAKKLKMNGEEVEFHSLAEMRSLAAEIERKLNPGRKSRVSQINTSSGWR
ncbi:phage head-tail joining protein [Ruegeria sp. Ofav3-42]|uniref:phage head-tail joining protein n=1 Tax=Ruegeria sp. Ofav3-42 TaxID=2917759 RepID=UPI00351D21E0